jgi:hypothetical protein
MKPKTFVMLFVLLCILASITFFVLNREKPSSKIPKWEKCYLTIFL